MDAALDKLTNTINDKVRAQLAIRDARINELDVKLAKLEGQFSILFELLKAGKGADLLVLPKRSGHDAA
jgi:hypothetical protein